MLNKDHKSADLPYLWAEKITYAIFPKIFEKLNLSPRQITTINFFVNCLGAVFFFSFGKYWANLVGIAFIISETIWDWMDGSVAKAKHNGSKGGAFIDPAFDFIFQNLLIASISIGVFISSGKNFVWLVLGFLALVALVFSNYFGELFKNEFGFDFRGDYDEFLKKVDNSKRSDWFDKLTLEILTYRKFVYIFFFTVRYPFLIGALTNKLNYYLIFLLIVSLIKGISLFYSYYSFLEIGYRKKSRIIAEALEERYNYWQNEKFKNFKK